MELSRDYSNFKLNFPHLPKKPRKPYRKNRKRVKKFLDVEPELANARLKYALQKRRTNPEFVWKKKYDKYTIEQLQRATQRLADEREKILLEKRRIRQKQMEEYIPEPIDPTMEKPTGFNHGTGGGRRVIRDPRGL
jgi:hypothetical protein